MGEIFLSPEILELVLQFADGETLLMCREVSPEFEAAVKYLGKTKNIWKKCYSKEKGNKYPYDVISKLYPHSEGFEHDINWGIIYELSLLENFISTSDFSTNSLEELKIGKEYSDILDVETHEDLILLLVKYNKDFSNYCKIITVNLQNVIVDKSCKFNASMLYITPIEDQSHVKEDAIMLSCDLCHLVAVPINAKLNILGFPKFNKNDKYLTVEHSNGDILWINSFGKFISKKKCFHTGLTATHEEIRLKDFKSVKVCHRFLKFYISCGVVEKEFNTYTELRAKVTASLVYSDILILGTDSGMLYAYSLEDESAVQKLDLKCYFWHFDVCHNPILVINVMELKNQFVIVCCSRKTVYHVHINRKLQNFT